MGRQTSSPSHYEMLLGIWLFGPLVRSPFWGYRSPKSKLLQALKTSTYLDDAINSARGSLVKNTTWFAHNRANITLAVSKGRDWINLDLALFDELVSLVKNLSTARCDQITISGQLRSWCSAWYGLVGFWSG